MKAILVTGLFDMAARLPLRLLHAAGALLGRLMYALDRKYAARLHENLAHEYRGRPQAEFRQVLAANIREMGKSLCELPFVWRRQRGQGIIFLTPHLGCFEIVALYLAARMPITIMYRPPKLAWLDGVMRAGRTRGQTMLARTDVSGVRAMFKALKRGEAIGLLPDQVPGNGEGEWADFFGRPAYTMTLVGRLAESSKAMVVMSYGERLPHGAGYVLHFTPLDLSPHEPVGRQINAALENVIRERPEQYLWSYNRYKVPAGVQAPPLAEGEQAGGQAG